MQCDKAKHKKKQEKKTPYTIPRGRTNSKIIKYPNRMYKRY